MRITCFLITYSQEDLASTWAVPTLPAIVGSIAKRVNELQDVKVLVRRECVLEDTLKAATRRSLSSSCNIKVYF